MVGSLSYQVEGGINYGRGPFKMVNFWMLQDGFDQIVREAWSHREFDGEENKFLVFKNKVKHLKNKLRSWNKSNKEQRKKERTCCANWKILIWD